MRKSDILVSVQQTYLLDSTPKLSLNPVRAVMGRLGGDLDRMPVLTGQFSGQTDTFNISTHRTTAHNSLFSTDTLPLSCDGEQK